MKILLFSLVCVFINSGIVCSSLGSSSVYQGLLTKEDVLTATTKDVVNQGEYKRMYGAGWWTGLKSAVSTAIKVAPHAVNAYKAMSGAGWARGRAAGPSDKLKDRFY